VLHGAVKALVPFWKPPRRRAQASLPTADIHALGWLGPSRFAPVAREVVVRDILDPLATIGIAISDDEREALLA
jgi:hypothetical protein